MSSEVKRVSAVLFRCWLCLGGTKVVRAPPKRRISLSLTLEETGSFRLAGVRYYWWRHQGDNRFFNVLSLSLLFRLLFGRLPVCLSGCLSVWLPVGLSAGLFVARGHFLLFTYESAVPLPVLFSDANQPEALLCQSVVVATDRWLLVWFSQTEEPPTTTIIRPLSDRLSMCDTNYICAHIVYI